MRVSADTQLQPAIRKVNEREHTPAEKEARAPEILDDVALEGELRKGEMLYEMGM